jgi:16S rRNA processing protein RimM
VTDPAARWPDPPDDAIVIGQIVGAHGLKGELKVRLETDFPNRFKAGRAVTVGDSLYTVRRARVTDAGAIVLLSDVDDRDAADALRGQWIAVPEDDLPPLPKGEFYHHQLIGLSAITPAGEPLGPLTDILTTRANDVYVVKTANGDMYVPAIEDVVLSIDVENGAIVIAPLEGMLPEPPKPKG